MKKGKRKFKKFDKYHKDRSKTSSYPPPKHVIEPAPNDKGYFLVKSEFDKMTKKFDVGFFSSN
jgi:hypothetical protein